MGPSGIALLASPAAASWAWKALTALDINAEQSGYLPKCYLRGGCHRTLLRVHLRKHCYSTAAKSSFTRMMWLSSRSQPKTTRATPFSAHPDCVDAPPQVVDGTRCACAEETHNEGYRLPVLRFHKPFTALQGLSFPLQKERLDQAYSIPTLLRPRRS